MEQRRRRICSVEEWTRSSPGRVPQVAGTSWLMHSAVPLPYPTRPARLQTQYTYEPFGGTTVVGGPTSNPFQYTGREIDSAGLYFYRARYSTL
jgi:hypothetical protein